MPTYQYACTQCSEELEAVQSFSDAALTECPACGGRLRKKFGAVGVVFKGSGFYKTDSRASSSKGSSEGSGSSSSGGDSSTSSTPSSTPSSSSKGSSSGTPAPTPSTTSSKTAASA